MDRVARGVLRDAIERRSLTDALSVAQTLSARIHPDGLLPPPLADRPALPDRVAADRAGFLTQLWGLLDDRRAVLAEQVAADPPGWATAALGLVPEDPTERAGWLNRAGTIAAYREAAGWTDPDHALGRCPGVHTPERRAAWHAAFTAAGMPEERRPEAEMTTGRLLVRAEAAARAQANAPAAVYDSQREQHLAAEQARRDAILARAQGQGVQADQLELQAGAAAASAAELDIQSEARGGWLAYYAETFRAGNAAVVELRRRGVDAADGTDQTPADEWLAAERAARATDDQYRDIAETDLADATIHEPRGSGTAHEALDGSAQAKAAQEDVAESAPEAKPMPAESTLAPAVGSAGATAAPEVAEQEGVAAAAEPAIVGAEPVSAEPVNSLAGDSRPAGTDAEVTAVEVDAAEPQPAVPPEEVATNPVDGAHSDSGESVAEVEADEMPSADALAVEVHAATARAHAAIDEVADHTSADAAQVTDDEWDYGASADHHVESADDSGHEPDAGFDSADSAGSANDQVPCSVDPHHRTRQVREPGLADPRPVQRRLTAADLAQRCERFLQ